MELDKLSITSITAYRVNNILQHTDQDRTNLPLIVAVNGIYNKTFTQEIDFASQLGGALNWTAGSYFYDSRQRIPVDVYPGATDTARSSCSVRQDRERHNSSAYRARLCCRPIS